MFSLIVIVLSIALAVGLVAATAYFGGASITEARAIAEAARLKTEEQQLFAAAESFQAQYGRWPQDLPELVTSGMLKSIPPGSARAEVPFLADVIPSAHAQQIAPGWRTLISGQPIFTTASGIDRLVCRKYNQASRGDDGILDRVYTELVGQCFGVNGAYAVIAAKGSAAQHMAGAVGVAQAGPVPVSVEHPHWDTSPGDPTNGGPRPPVVNPPESPPGERAELTLNATASMDFGEIEVGSRATGVAVTLRNNGTVAAQDVRISAPTGFAIVNNDCASVLVASQQCSFAVQFSPNAEGPINSAVEIVSSNASALSLGVSGNGRVRPPAPVLTLSNASAIEFGEVVLRQTRRSETRVLKNEGNAPAKGLYLYVYSPFSVVNSTCTTTLEAGQECAFQIQYLPVASGPNVANFTITSQEIQYPDNPRITLSGRALTIPMSLVPSEAENYGNVPLQGSALGQTRVLTNNGDVAVEGLSITGDHAFTVHASTCGSSIQPGQSCSFAIQFTPWGQYQHTSPILISSSNADRLNFTATGYGQAVPKLELSQRDPEEFGNVAVGSRKQGTMRSLHNSGTAAIVGLTIQPPSGVNIVFSDCGYSLEPGRGCSFIAEFAPFNPGSLNGVLSVSASQVGGFQIEMRGYGAQPEYELSSWSPETFGQIRLGQRAQSEIRVVRNIGVIDLEGLTINAPVGFRVSNGCPQRLAVGEACQYLLEFAPTVIGYASGLLEIRANNHAPAAYPVSGMGVGFPILEMNPSTDYWFGEVAVGNSSVSPVWTIRNSGTAATQALGISVGAGFQIIDSTCASGRIEPNQSCSFAVKFTPTAPGIYGESMRVTTPAAGSFYVHLSGYGTSP